MKNAVLTRPVQHPLTGPEASELVEALGVLGLPVVVDLDDELPAVHIWACRDMDSREEAVVLRMFIEHTDERVCWRGCLC